jgi:nucleotide sugar dehydrogenase
MEKLNAVTLENLDRMIGFPLEPIQHVYRENRWQPLIQIIGLGTVGEAQAYVFRKLGCDVCGYDPFLKGPPFEDMSFSSNKPFAESDITFICTMESQVEDVVKELKALGYMGLIVIKSSVVPKTTKFLMLKYGLHICHNPEFVRERTSLQEVLIPDRVVIGQCCEKHGKQLERLYRPLGSQVIRVDPTTSETAKLLSNSYLALMISFWNQTHQLAQKLNISTSDLSKIVTADKRISKHGTKWFGESFDGKCLPKDLGNLISAFKAEDLQPALLEATRQINDALTRKERQNDA